MNNQKYFRQLCMSVLLAFGSHAVAADDVAVYSEAGKKLEALVAKAEKADDAEMLQTEEMSQLVTVLSDDERFLQAKPYSKDQLGDLIQLCSKSNKAVMSLALFHLKGSIDPKADRKVIAQQVAVLMDKNVQMFDRYLKRLQPFMIRCTARQVKPMGEFMASLAPEEMTSVRRKGLEQARNGFAQLFVGVVKSSNDEKYLKAYRFAIVKALAESAPELISTLPVEMRDRIQTIATANSDSVPDDFKPYMKQIYQALDNKECKGLCAI